MIIQHCKTSCRKSDLAHIYCIPSRVNKNLHCHVFEQDVVCRRAVFVTGQIQFFGGEGQWSGGDPLYYIGTNHRCLTSFTLDLFPAIEEANLCKSMYD